MSQYGYHVIRPSHVFSRAAIGVGGSSSARVESCPTIVQALTGKNFSVSPFDAGGLKADPGKACANLGELQGKTASIEQGIKTQSGSLEKHWDTMKAQAYEAVAAVAIDQGLNPVAAWARLSPTPSPAEFQIMIDVATGMAATGAGSFATFLKSPTTSFAEAMFDTTMGPDKAKSIAAEAYVRMTSESTPNFTPLKPKTPISPLFERSAYKWDNLGEYKFIEFIASNLKTQPEMMALDAAQASIDSVKENHKHCSDRAELDEGDKLQEAEKRGDHKTVTAMTRDEPQLRHDAPECLVRSAALLDTRGIKEEGAENKGILSGAHDVSAMSAASLDTLKALNPPSDPAIGLHVPIPSDLIPFRASKPSGYGLN